MKLVEFVQAELKRQEEEAEKRRLEEAKRQEKEKAGREWAKNQIIEQLCAEHDLDQDELNEITTCDGSNYRSKRLLGKMFPSSAPEDAWIPEIVFLCIRLSAIVNGIRSPEHAEIRGDFDLDQSCTRYNVRQWVFGNFVYHSLFSALQAARKHFGDERFFSSLPSSTDSSSADVDRKISVKSKEDEN